MHGVTNSWPSQGFSSCAKPSSDTPSVPTAEEPSSAPHSDLEVGSQPGLEAFVVGR